MTEQEAFRMAYHDSVCRNGGQKCALREGHAKRIMSDSAAQWAVVLFNQYKADS